MNIVVLDGHTLNPGDNPWDELASLGNLTVHDRTADNEILPRSQNVELLFTNKTPLSKEILDQLADLKMIGVLATGYNIVDTEAARARDVPVCNIPVYGTDSVAQYVFAQLLEFCHHIPLHDQAVRNGRWAEVQEFSFWETPLVELAGKTMGIVGFGRIGRRVGELANAFGMDVVAFDVYHGDLPQYESFQWLSIEELFEQADVISLHCNQTDDNAEFVNRNLLQRMKPTALFINAARGWAGSGTGPRRRPEFRGSGGRRAGRYLQRTDRSDQSAAAGQECGDHATHCLGNPCGTQADDAYCVRKCQGVHRRFALERRQLTSCMSSDFPNILASRYASNSIKAIWSDQNRVVLERQTWIAVLKAQKQLGIEIPPKSDRRL